MSGELLHPPEDIIQQMLVDLGQGTIGGDDDDWSVYSGDFPGGTDDIISVFGTQGLIQGRDHNSGEQAEKFGIQVRVRAGNVVDGYLKIKQIFDALTKQVLRREVQLDMEVYLVQSVTATSTVIPLGKTGTDRNRQYVANFIASIALESTVGSD